MTKNFKRNFQLIIGTLLVAGAILSISLAVRPEASGGLKVYFLNVGQGDASYLKTPSGQDILIDGGPDDQVLTELGKVMDFNDREINLVILSHPHADHLGGLIEVLKRYQVDEVWETGVEYPSATYDTWKNQIKSQNISDLYVKAGDSKDFNDVKISVLYPLSPLQSANRRTTIDNLNNASIVNKVSYKDFSVLFSGDAEKDVQKEILNQNLFATVLKVSHHGGENGLLEDFLKVTRPAVAVISVGKDNKYGHPSAVALNLLKKYGTRIYRTDQNGTVEIFSDGQGYQTKTAY